MADYSKARYYAISGIGYGKGFTPEEALENYVAIQLRNHPAKNTIFGTKAKWEAALRDGEAKPIVWHAPEGTTGFVLEGGGTLLWVDGHDNYTPAEADQRITEQKE